MPEHLKQFIVDQNYEQYTPINQEVWRYVMGQNVRFLSKVAHGSYLNGLQEAGISLDKIPSIYGMNRILKEIGWSAVAVDGFIPPNAFDIKTILFFILFLCIVIYNFNFIICSNIVFKINSPIKK